MSLLLNVNLTKASIDGPPDYGDNPCLSLMEGGQGNSVAVWLCTSSTLMSMCCGLALAICCGWIRRKHPKELFVYLLMQIGVADVLLALWQLGLDIFVLNGGKEIDCTFYMFVQRVLIMLTTLDALALAFGMVMQLNGRRSIPWVLWQSPFIIVPLSVLMELVYLLAPDDVQKDLDFVELCLSNGPASHVYIFEVSSIFLATVVLHIVVIKQAWRTAPRSVTRRSVWSASRYLLAFFATHVLHVGYKIWLWRDPEALGQCGFEITRVVGNMSLNLNGFYNFLAFWIHARRVARAKNAKAEAHVNFRGEQSLAEELEIPHGEEHRRSVAIKRDPTKVKEWLTDELGSCLGDLYTSSQSTTADELTTEMDSEYTRTQSSDGFIDD